MPPPAVAQPPTRWGTEAAVQELLGDHVTDLRTSTRAVRQRFTSAAAFADLFLTHYGPTHTAASRLDEAGRTALRQDMVALAESFNGATDGTLECDPPSSLDVSREAARRHEHLSGVRERNRADRASHTPRHPQRWLSPRLRVLRLLLG